MNIKLMEEGNNIVLKATQDIYHKIAKEEDTQIKKLMVDYAKEHNAEIRFIDEDKVKLIIDLGCKEYLKNHRSGYISKDKIKQIINKYVNIEEHLKYTNKELFGEDLKNMILELLEEN